MSEHNTHAGHEYIDLGLSVNWAVANVGAEHLGEAGRYFSFEEIFLTEFAGKDPAHDLWGGEWRMPTPDEMNELSVFCDIKRAELYNASGFIVSRNKKNTLFFPAAGVWCEQDEGKEEVLEYFGNTGYYWSSYHGPKDAISWLAMDDAMSGEADDEYGIYTTMMITWTLAWGRVPIRPVFAKK